MCARTRAALFWLRRSVATLPRCLAHFRRGRIPGQEQIDQLRQLLDAKKKNPEGETIMNTLIDMYRDRRSGEPPGKRHHWPLMVVVLLRALRRPTDARWRFLLWGVVVARLLMVATPGSTGVYSIWSAGVRRPAARPIAQHEADAPFTPAPHSSESDNRLARYLRYQSPRIGSPRERLP